MFWLCQNINKLINKHANGIEIKILGLYNIIGYIDTPFDHADKNAEIPKTKSTIRFTIRTVLCITTLLHQYISLYIK